jgi:hypothetical protein
MKAPYELMVLVPKGWTVKSTSKQSNENIENTTKVDQFGLESLLTYIGDEEVSLF